MANHNMIEHTLDVLDQYEAKALRADQVAALVDQYAPALEDVSVTALELIRRGCSVLAKYERDAEHPAVAAALLAGLRTQIRKLGD